MKAILKEIYSNDIIQPLKDYSPPIKNKFCIPIRLIVGEEKIGGEESFDVILCTPNWLVENNKSSDIIFGRHHLIVFEYNYSQIYKTLKEIVENTEGENWNEIGMKLSRIGKWEFEDYKE